jgi:gluconokinase
LIVVVFGVAGSGKSTVGSALAAALDWSFCEGDDFHPPANRARMRAGHPLGDAQRMPWLEAMALSIAAQVQAGRSAVYACSALRRAYRALLVRAIDADAARFVYLHVPRTVLRARLQARANHFFRATLLDSQLRDLEPPGDEEPAATLEIDGGAPVADVVAAIRCRLKL